MLYALQVEVVSMPLSLGAPLTLSMKENHVLVNFVHSEWCTKTFIIKLLLRLFHC